MKTKLTLILGLLTAALGLPAFAQGTAFTYQGRLDTNDVPYSGSAEIQATLWNMASAGSQIAANTPAIVSVDVVSGLFLLPLDFGPVFDGGDRWLQLDVRTAPGPFTPLSPRQPLLPTPYAIYALTAKTATTVGPGGVTTASLAPGAVDSAAIADASVVTPDLANNAVTSAKIANGAVATVDLADGAVTSAKIADATILPADLSTTLLNDTFWRRDGNAGTTPGTHFLGTTDNQPLEIKVNGLRALRLEPTLSAPNVIGGSSANTVEAGVTGATIAGGELNTIGLDASRSVIGGGNINLIADNSDAATISGGARNNIGKNAGWSTIGGGTNNIIMDSTWAATIAGGIANDIGVDSDYSAIGGGTNNNIGDNSRFATIAGGRNNGISVNSGSSAIGGGYENSIGDSSLFATIAGGDGNNIGTNSGSTTIGGGSDNKIGPYATFSAIGGGVQNHVASNSVATIGGGFHNLVGGPARLATVLLSPNQGNTINGGTGNQIVDGTRGAYIGGGNNNTVLTNADYATIPGGRENSATNYAFAAGRQAKANHQGAFVWADSQAADVESTASDQVTFRAQNGLRLTEDAGDAKTISIGDRYRDNALLAWGKVAANGTLFAAFGVSSVTNHSAGVYEIFLTDTAATIHSLIPMAIAELDGAPASAAAARIVSIDQNSSTASRFRIYINTGNYALVNNDFVFLVTAR